MEGTSPVVQWLRLHASIAGGMSSISGWETKIPTSHTVWSNKLIKDWGPLLWGKGVLSFVCWIKLSCNGAVKKKQKQNENTNLCPGDPQLWSWPGWLWHCHRRGGHLHWWKAWSSYGSSWTGRRWRGWHRPTALHLRSNQIHGQFGLGNISSPPAP